MSAQAPQWTQALEGLLPIVLYQTGDRLRGTGLDETPLGSTVAGDLVLRLRAADNATSKPRKAVIMVYLNGVPSHVDMYDLKPAAPDSMRVRPR